MENLYKKVKITLLFWRRTSVPPKEIIILHHMRYIIHIHTGTAVPELVSRGDRTMSPATQILPPPKN